MPFHQLLGGGILLLSYLSTTRAVNATTISSVGCVDPSTFDTCISAASSTLTACANKATGHELAELYCLNSSEESFLLLEYSECHVQHWTTLSPQVCSCEYQRVSNDICCFRRPCQRSCSILACSRWRTWGLLVQHREAIIHLSQHQTICDKFGLSAANLLACGCCTWAAAFAAYISFPLCLAAI
jgi:hypothetical protein